MNIAILLNFYQCRAELEKVLSSIPANCFEYLIAVDGIYRFHKEKYPDMPELSDDGSREAILQSQNIPNKIIMDMPNKTEHEKRNKYLEICETLKDVDVGIIIDSDEAFIYPEIEETALEAFNKFKKNLETTIRKHPRHNVFSIRSLNMNVYPHYEAYHPRVWGNPGQMRYLNGSHYYYANIYREKKEIETFAAQRYNYVQYSVAVIKGLLLAHSHALRSKEYMKQREEYIEYIKRFEGLTQSFYFNLEQSHRLAMLGVNRDQVNLNNKDEIIEKMI